MIRLRSDELILRDGTVVCFGTGRPGAPAPVTFASLRAMNAAIVKAVFSEFLRRGKGASSSYWYTAEECGYDSPTSIQRIVAGKRLGAEA